MRISREAILHGGGLGFGKKGFLGMKQETLRPGYKALAGNISMREAAGRCCSSMEWLVQVATGGTISTPSLSSVYAIDLVNLVNHNE